MKKVSAALIGILSSLVVGLAIGTAHAAPKPLATYKDWIVYTNDLGGDTVCYAISEPKSKSPRSVDHGNVYFMVATWKSGVAKNQPSFMSGYALRGKPEPIVRIGSDKWDMFIEKNEGFIEKQSSEQRLVSGMRRGSDMRVTAVSERGTSTNYTFSLLGISAALDRVAKACR